jgi:hypothetical protein
VPEAIGAELEDELTAGCVEHAERLNAVIAVTIINHLTIIEPPCA